MNETEIIERIRITSDEGINFLNREVGKFLKLIEEDLQKLQEKANDYKKSIENDRRRWEQIKAEVKLLEDNREALKKREEEVDQRVKAVNEESASLAELHKVLENRKKLLEAREAEVATKVRRAREV